MATARRRPPRRRTRRGWLVVVALVTAVVLGGVGAVAAVVTWLDRATKPPVIAACTATTDAGSWRLSPEQAENAALIAAIALRRGLPARAATIALATAEQESKLSNIDHGDLDSLGLFQQRPSMGWGTAQQVMDPVHATNTFYDRLVTVPGYTTLPITQAAQAVQRSAYPEAYAEGEPLARAFASALTGWSPAALTCRLPAASAPGSSDAVVARVARDLGNLPSSSTAVDEARRTEATVTLDASSLTPDDTARGTWAVAQWAVALADTLHVDKVQVADRVWTRTATAWTTNDPAPVAAGRVVVTLADQRSSAGT